MGELLFSTVGVVKLCAMFFIFCTYIFIILPISAHTWYLSFYDVWYKSCVVFVYTIQLLNNFTKCRQYQNPTPLDVPRGRNKSLMFSFVMLERGLEWYRRLLIPSLPNNQQLNINPKNCIGTVLSINGYRKYFCEC